MEERDQLKGLIQAKMDKGIKIMFTGATTEWEELTPIKQLQQSELRLILLMI